MKVCYWREKVPGTYDANNRFPCFILTEGEESKHHIYGLPSHEYPGLVKVGGATVAVATRLGGGGASPGKKEIGNISVPLAAWLRSLTALASL